MQQRPATRVDPARWRVCFADGGEERYDALISTLPLDRLVALPGVETLRSAAAKLESTTVHVIGIGLEGATPEPLVDRRWIYFPDPSLPFPARRPRRELTKPPYSGAELKPSLNALSAHFEAE